MRTARYGFVMGLVWLAATGCDGSCPNGQAGCAEGCSDECADPGMFDCADGDDGLVVCADFDDDGCLEWGGAQPCPDGTVCAGASCVADPDAPPDDPESGCHDDCAEGDRSCDGDAVRDCGQYDDDPCLDWSPPDPCDDGQQCAAGTCDTRQCLAEGEDCVCGEDACCEGHCCPVLFQCVSFEPNGDVCPFGPGPNAP